MTERGISFNTIALIATKSFSPKKVFRVGDQVHLLAVAEALRLLGSDESAGLTSAEAASRTLRYGANKIPMQEKTSSWAILWGQINSILIYILLIGAGISFGFHNLVNGCVILAVIVINVALGYIMESKAENATAALTSLMSPSATVLRNHEKVTIEAVDLTIGDIFFLEAGNVVPADGRIIRSFDLHVLEASLTGESKYVLKTSEPCKPSKATTASTPTSPVSRGEEEYANTTTGVNPGVRTHLQPHQPHPSRSEADVAPVAEVPLAERKCMVYSGTQILKGTAVCLAAAVGADCEIGKISSMLSGIKKEKTPLLIQIEKLGVGISAIIVCLAALTCGIALARNYRLVDALSFAIGIAVAAIPEGLPSCIIITFAIGVSYMASCNAIVKSLPAVETLGSVSVICSDKTGTLTLNKMTVKTVVTADATFEIDDRSCITETHTVHAPPPSPTTPCLATAIASNAAADADIQAAYAAVPPLAMLFPLDNNLCKGPRERELFAALLPGILCNDAIVRSGTVAAGGARGGGGERRDGEEVKEEEAGEEKSTITTTASEALIHGDPTETSILSLTLELTKQGTSSSVPTAASASAVAATSASVLRAYRKQYDRAAEVPFDSANKYMATLHHVSLPLPVHRSYMATDRDADRDREGEDREIDRESDRVGERVGEDRDSKYAVIFMKGAPEKILTFCTSSTSPPPFSPLVTSATAATATTSAAAVRDYHHSIQLLLCPAALAQQQYWTDRAAAIAGRGMRVLALAYKIVPQEEGYSNGTESSCSSPLPFPLSPLSPSGGGAGSWLRLGGFTMTCLVGMMDPPRSEAVEAIKAAHRAGICVKMITGDHPATALAIGQMLGLTDFQHQHQHQNQRSRPANTGQADACYSSESEGEGGNDQSGRRGRRGERTGEEEEHEEGKERDSDTDSDLAPEELLQTDVDLTRLEEGRRNGRRRGEGGRALSSRRSSNSRSNSSSSGSSSDSGSRSINAVSGADLDHLLQAASTPSAPGDSNNKDFDECVLNNNIFARTTPEHKLKIVQSLKRQGLVCSMTGDGVNDAPALKAADIGVAMGITGTQVARDAANIILTDDNFATLVDAIRIGRCTYANLLKIITFVLPTNGGQAFSIIFALIINVQVPITALQILWVNMVTSVTLGLVLAFDQPGDEVLTAKPRARGKMILGRFLVWRFIYCSALLTAAVLGIFHWEEQRLKSLNALRTVTVNCLSVCQMGYVFSCRNLRGVDVSAYRLFSGNPMIYVGLLAVTICQVLFTYSPGFQYLFQTEPMDGVSWGKCVLFAVGVFVMVEIDKVLGRAKRIHWFNRPNS